MLLDKHVSIEDVRVGMIHLPSLPRSALKVSSAYGVSSIDALGHPLSFDLTPGQACNLDGFELLLPKLMAQTILADSGYDATSKSHRTSDCLRQK